MLSFHLAKAVNSPIPLYEFAKNEVRPYAPTDTAIITIFLGNTIHARLPQRHLYDCIKNAITEFCTESIVAIIASVIDAK